MHTHCMLAAMLLVLLLVLHATSTHAAPPDEEASTLQELQEQLKALKNRVAELETNGAPGPAAATPLLPPRANLQRTLAQRPSAWADHAALLAAVSADARVTAAAGLPEPPNPGRGAPLLTVIGDSEGRLYFFSPDGVLLHERATTGPPSAVTALAACGPGVGNRSVIAAGRADGAVELLKVLHDHAGPRGGAGGGAGSFAAASGGGAVYSVEPLLLSTAADRLSDRAAAAAAVAAAMAAAGAKNGGKGGSGGGRVGAAAEEQLLLAAQQQQEAADLGLNGIVALQCI
ncbi:hypothetical protein MNEG_8252, partial [Monoraphidium neglectum]